MIVDERSTPPEAQDNSENANAGFEPSQDPPNEDNDNPASPEHHDIDRPTAQGDSNSPPPPPPHNPNTPENNHAGGPSWGRIGAMAIGGTMCIAPMLVAAPVLGLVGFGAAGPIAGSIATGWQAAFGAGAAGGVFATLQSAAMGGYGVTAVSGVTQAIGAASLIALRQRRSESSSSCSSSESCPCPCHSPQRDEAPSPLSPPSEPSPPTHIDTPPPPYSPADPTLPSAAGRCADSCPCSCHRTPAPDSSSPSEKR